MSGGVTSLEEEARILQGPTMKSMASEEAMLLRDEETPTVDNEAVFGRTGNPHARNVE